MEKNTILRSVFLLDFSQFSCKILPICPMIFDAHWHQNFIDFWYPFAFPIHYFSTNFPSLRPSNAKNDILQKYAFSLEKKSLILRFRAFLRTANSTNQNQNFPIHYFSTNFLFLRASNAKNNIL